MKENYSVCVPKMEAVRSSLKKTSRQQTEQEIAPGDRVFGGVSKDISERENTRDWPCARLAAEKNGNVTECHFFFK